jgi:hypothetical protein
MQHKAAKAASTPAQCNTSLQRQLNFQSVKAFQASECSLKATHAVSRLHISTQRQRNAAQVGEGYFSSSEIMKNSAKEAQHQQTFGTSQQKQPNFKSANAFQVRECSFKAAHVGSTPTKCCKS